ncbi:MAG: peptidoglycan editing factor PgeF [Hyphococcus sp.]
MTAPPFLSSAVLAHDRVLHGFFGRTGGVSAGIYASLNTGPGSNDRSEDVAENRRRCAQAIGLATDYVVTAYQVHSAEVEVLETCPDDARPKVDGLVTKTPGLPVGVLAADCMPWLLADPEAGVVGAAHAGWRGALAGVLENTVATMISLGAQPSHIAATLGPCLRQPNFEVGLDLLDAFIAKHPASERFFAAGAGPAKRQFDLAGYGAWRLREAGVGRIDDLDRCTLAAPEAYFSYRGSRQRGEEDYGRNLSVIALVENS